MLFQFSSSYILNGVSTQKVFFNIVKDLFKLFEGLERNVEVRRDSVIKKFLT